MSENLYPNGGTPPTVTTTQEPPAPALPKTGGDSLPIFDIGLAAVLLGAALVVIAKARPWRRADR